MAMEEGAEMSNGDNAHDINSLLSSPGRDFLLRNNGDQMNMKIHAMGVSPRCYGLQFPSMTQRPVIGFLNCSMGGDTSLVILDGNGKVVSQSGADIFCVYGMEAYPFTPERIMEVKEAKKAESLTAKFLSQSRDFLISNDGTKNEFNNQVK